MANYEERTDRFTAIEEDYAGFTVRDPNGEKIGKVDDLFLDENNEPEYIGVKMGFLGTRSTLIPMDVCTVDESQGFIEVSQPKSTVKEGPSFDDDREIIPEYEQQVRSHYGLQATEDSAARGTYGAYYYDDEDGHNGQTGYADEERRDREREGSGEVGPGMRMGDTESGEFRGHGREQEGVNQPGSDLEDEDELRVHRTEEELRAGTREREAGALNVRKRVRTDREQIRVPKRREEVNVERVPVNEERTGAEIGDDEVSVPVVEEEVVVEKRPVVKEEVRIRKDVVQDEEVVEEDVRKEEVDVEDSTTTRGGDRGADRNNEPRGRTDRDDETGRSVR